MNLPELFRHYLKSQKISSVTVKNYVADINNFFNWLATKTGIRHQVAGKTILKLLTKETVEEYKTSLVTEEAPFSTINRRLSALRKFGQFSLDQGWLTKNEIFQVANLRSPAVDLQSPNEKVIVKFKKHLEKEEASPVTIKNYLSDLRHFLAWLELTVVN